MISSVMIEVGGEQHALRLTTRAMLTLERRFDKRINEILEDLRNGIGVAFVVDFFGAVMNDGAGADEDRALAMIDAAGGPFSVMEKVTEVIEAAFPEVKAAAGNAKAAGKTKPPRTR